MKQLEIEKMSNLTGGWNWGNFIDGACGAVAAYGVYTLIVSATVPIAGIAAASFCLGWAVGRGAASVD
jgi:hypothetical protein